MTATPTHGPNSAGNNNKSKYSNTSTTTSNNSAVLDLRAPLRYELPSRLDSVAAFTLWRSLRDFERAEILNLTEEAILMELVESFVNKYGDVSKCNIDKGDQLRLCMEFFSRRLQALDLKAIMSEVKRAFIECIEKQQKVVLFENLLEELCKKNTLRAHHIDDLSFFTRSDGSTFIAASSTLVAATTTTTTATTKNNNSSTTAKRIPNSGETIIIDPKTLTGTIANELINDQTLQRCISEQIAKIMRGCYAVEDPETEVLVFYDFKQQSHEVEIKRLLLEQQKLFTDLQQQLPKQAHPHKVEQRTKSTTAHNNSAPERASNAANYRPLANSQNHLLEMRKMIWFENIDAKTAFSVAMYVWTGNHMLMKRMALVGRFREEYGDELSPDRVRLLTEHIAKLQSSMNRAQLMKIEGNEYFHQKQYQKAAECYTESIKLSPQGDKNKSLYYSNRAACYLHMGRYVDAANDCTEALKLSSDLLKALYRRAQAYEQLGNVDNALNDIKRLLQFDQTNNEAQKFYVRLVNTTQKQDKPAETKPNDTAATSSQPAGLSLTPQHNADEKKTKNQEQQADTKKGAANKHDAKPVEKKEPSKTQKQTTAAVSNSGASTTNTTPPPSTITTPKPSSTEDTSKTGSSSKLVNTEKNKQDAKHVQEQPSKQANKMASSTAGSTGQPKNEGAKQDSKTEAKHETKQAIKPTSNDVKREIANNKLVDGPKSTKQASEAPNDQKKEDLPMSTGTADKTSKSTNAEQTPSKPAQPDNKAVSNAAITPSPAPIPKTDVQTAPAQQAEALAVPTSTSAKNGKAAKSKLEAKPEPIPAPKTKQTTKPQPSSADTSKEAAPTSAQAQASTPAPAPAPQPQTTPQTAVESTTPAQHTTPTITVVRYSKQGKSRLDEFAEKLSKKKKKAEQQRIAQTSSQSSESGSIPAFGRYLPQENAWTARANAHYDYYVSLSDETVQATANSDTSLTGGEYYTASVGRPGSAMYQALTPEPAIPETPSVATAPISTQGMNSGSQPSPPVAPPVVGPTLSNSTDITVNSIPSKPTPNTFGIIGDQQYIPQAHPQHSFAPFPTPISRGYTPSPELRQHETNPAAATSFVSSASLSINDMLLKDLISSAGSGGTINAQQQGAAAWEGPFQKVELPHLQVPAYAGPFSVPSVTSPSMFGASNATTGFGLSFESQTITQGVRRDEDNNDDNGLSLFSRVMLSTTSTLSSNSNNNIDAILKNDQQSHGFYSAFTSGNNPLFGGSFTSFFTPASPSSAIAPPPTTTGFNTTVGSAVAVGSNISASTGIGGGGGGSSSSSASLAPGYMGLSAGPFHQVQQLQQQLQYQYQHHQTQLQQQQQQRGSFGPHLSPHVAGDTSFMSSVMGPGWAKAPTPVITTGPTLSPSPMGSFIGNNNNSDDNGGGFTGFFSNSAIMNFSSMFTGNTSNIVVGQSSTAAAAAAAASSSFPHHQLTAMQASPHFLSPFMQQQQQQQQQQ